MVMEVQGCLVVSLAAHFAAYLSQWTFNPVSGYNSNEGIGGNVNPLNGPAKPKLLKLPVIHNVVNVDSLIISSVRKRYSTLTTIQIFMNTEVHIT